MLLLAGLGFLFPIATYCLFLAVLNAREHPTMVSGVWDFAGALFGTSGFLLLGGPLVISSLNQRWREALVHGQVTGSVELWSWVWLLLWIGYFALVIAGVGYCLRRRRSCTVIYNIDPPLLEEALAQAAASLKLGTSRSGNRMVLRSLAPAGVGAAFTPHLGEGTLPLPDQAEVEIDPFPSLCNATLRWHDADAPLRRDVEAELARLFQSASIADNPAAGWFLTISTCLFGAIFVGLLAFLMFQIRR